MLMAAFTTNFIDKMRALVVKEIVWSVENVFVYIYFEKLVGCLE